MSLEFVRANMPFIESKLKLKVYIDIEDTQTAKDTSIIADLLLKWTLWTYTGHGPLEPTLPHTPLSPHPIL